MRITYYVCGICEASTRPDVPCHICGAVRVKLGRTTRYYNRQTGREMKRVIAYTVRRTIETYDFSDSVSQS
jgi:hypothetical protein